MCCYHCCCFCAVDGVAGVLATGKVNYTVILHTGACAIPPNTTLSIATRNTNSPPSPDISPIITPVCVNESGSGALTMTPGSEIPTEACGADIIWTCTFALDVTPNHKSGNLIQIGAFEVFFEYSGPGITPAFHIPAVTTDAAPVYTGGVMGVAPGEVVTTGDVSDKYIEGRYEATLASLRHVALRMHHSQTWHLACCCEFVASAMNAEGHVSAHNLKSSDVTAAFCSRTRAQPCG